MDDTLAILEQSVGRMLADHVDPRGTLAAEAAGIDAAAWRQLGLLGVAGPEAAGLDLGAHAVVLRAVGYAGALVPYADSEALGRWLAAAAGIDSVDEVLAVHVLPDGSARFEQGAWRLELDGQRIAWGRHARQVLFSLSAQGRDWVAAVPVESLALQPGANLASEPHDRVAAPGVVLAAGRLAEVAPAFAPDAVRARGALCRALQMQGAMARVNELTLRYAHERRQFSRSLAQYQIVQSYLAAMAGELCATEAAVEAALAACSAGEAGDEIAAAKVRAGQAARVVTWHGHQIHGAIGFTREFALNLWTRRLWAWREEYGNETFWAARLGASVVARGADELWPTLSAQRT